MVAIKRCLNFENQTSGFGDRRGGALKSLPPSQSRYGIYPSKARVNPPELVKVAGVAPTELQELGSGSQSLPTI